jgi:predicted metal-dependent phosphoesterase TrpH
MIKIELHAHTSDDPSDWIPHTMTTLIDHVARLGYRALAITLHDRQLDLRPHLGYARERGVRLLPGVERTFGRVHVLLVNFPPEAATLRTYDELAALKRRSNGLVIVPHPFYPMRSAMGRRMDAHRTWIDAVEWNAMYTRELNFNQRAAAWARANGKPLVGCSDVHRLEQLGTTHTLVDVPADADADAICEAIRAGRTELHTRPMGWPSAVSIITRMTIGGFRGSRDKLSAASRKL